MYRQSYFLFYAGSIVRYSIISFFFLGISADCDSGYEASTLESIPTCSLQTSPHTDSGDIPDSLSSLSEIFLTPSRADLVDTSQDSIEVEEDNVSTVSEISGLSDLSGQDWKPMAGSMIWVRF